MSLLEILVVNKPVADLLLYTSTSLEGERDFFLANGDLDRCLVLSLDLDLLFLSSSLLW